jgi:hypothetical protein
VTITLNACPFCGHQPWEMAEAVYPTGIGWREDDGVRHYIGRKDKRERMGDVWCVNCPEVEGGCGAEVCGDSRNEAVAKWNRRATP